MTHCVSCSYEIESTDLEQCCDCGGNTHGLCSIPCGAFEKNQDENENSRVRCDNVYCGNCAARSLTCKYPPNEYEVDSSDEIHHDNGVPLCPMHAAGCAFCRFSVCCEHMKPDYSIASVSFQVFECRNCGKQTCDLHCIMCEECGETECVVCAGLEPSQTESEWFKIYEGNYLCKVHRATQHDEAGVPRPNSPDGEPMTDATKQRLALYPKNHEQQNKHNIE